LRIIRSREDDFAPGLGVDIAHLTFFHRKAAASA
jgi:hypothetical protein